MTSVLIEHDVNDFATWKKAYERDAATRQKHGIKNEHVFQDAAQPNHVCVTCDFTNLQSLEKFMADPHLKQALKEGGVKGEPQIRVLEKPQIHIV